jgi:hypothetical protein
MAEGVREKGGNRPGSGQRPEKDMCADLAEKTGTNTASVAEASYVLSGSG